MVTWLHISDLHFPTNKGPDQSKILDALLKTVEDHNPKPDLIFVTGDIADRGLPVEYEFATAFFNELLAVAGLNRDRLFVVPGNHDVDRSVAVGLERTLTSEKEAKTYFAPGHPKHHLMQQRAFINWYDDYFAAYRSYDQDSTCSLEVVDISGRKVAVLCFNSALFCGSGGDHERLWLGHCCLDKVLGELKDHGNVALRVGLIHHPLQFLTWHERSAVTASFGQGLDVLLRGHYHETGAEQVFSRSGDLLHLAAGTAYDDSPYAKRAMYVTVAEQQLQAYPIFYNDNSLDHWTLDTTVFPAPDYIGRFSISPSLHSPAADAAVADDRLRENSSRYLSNIPRRRWSLVGRDEVLENMAQLLKTRDIGELVLHGPSGVGKTELAMEFARKYRDHYPGGTFFVDMSGSGPPLELVRVARNHLDRRFDSDLPPEDQCEQALLSFIVGRTLLIYDNVCSREFVSNWLPRAGMNCQVIITTNLRKWDNTWNPVSVDKLLPNAARDLIIDVAGERVWEEQGKSIIETGDGLPVMISPSAALAREVWEEQRDYPHVTTDTSHDSFSHVYSRLSADIRLLLHSAALLNCQRIISAELYGHLRDVTHWDKARFEQLIDQCRGLHLLQGGRVLQMHQLWATYILQAELTAAEKQQLMAIRRNQQLRIVQLARQIVDAPSQADLADLLTGYQLHTKAWELSGMEFSAWDHVWIGNALVEIGKFKDALEWYNRAVERLGRVDNPAHIDQECLGTSQRQIGFCYSELGLPDRALAWYMRSVNTWKQSEHTDKVNHEGLGQSLYRVGCCLSELKRYKEAQQWYERAVGETEKLDTYGEVSIQVLGSSLHEVGYCHDRLGGYEQALAWYERAIVVKQTPDPRGRTDHENLGKTLHRIGYCLDRLEQSERALSYLKRAVEHKQQGDIHGRVDNESLGRTYHWLGCCLHERCHHKTGKSWLELAVEAKGTGDIYRRVDYESLGRSLHWLAECCCELQEIDVALDTYVRAVEAKKKGDIYGTIHTDSLVKTLTALEKRLLQQLQRRSDGSQVDDRSLGRRLHWLGDCYGELGQVQEALGSYVQAVTAKRKGMIIGTVDDESMCESMVAVEHLARNMLARTSADVDGVSVGKTLHWLASCYSDSGNRDKALALYDLAVNAKKQGDSDGRVDHESIGMSLYQAGCCADDLGQQEQALSWFELAVKEKEKGDVGGRVDYESLGRTQHWLGYWLNQQGRHDAALKWLHLAANSKRRGNIKGEVDHESHGRSLHVLGNCYSERGQHDEALEYYRMAVKTKEQGNVLGRIHYDSLSMSMKALAECLQLLGCEDEAKEWNERAELVEKQHTDDGE